MDAETTEDETTEPGLEPEPGAEPVEPDSEEEAEAEEPTPEPEPEPEPNEPSAAELERIGKAIDKEQKAHTRKIEAILGDSAVDVHPCPLCFDGLQGFVYPGSGAALDEERKAIVYDFIGENAPGQLVESEGVEECPRCHGWGQLAFPTKVEHVKAQTCLECNGSGYVGAQPPKSVPATHQPPPAPFEPAAASNGSVCPICKQPLEAPNAPHWCVPVAA